MLAPAALLRSLCLILATLLLAPALAAQTYPDRSIRVVVPFSGGSASDVVARIVLDKMGPALGQQFVIENQPGAGGNIGTARDRPGGAERLPSRDEHVGSLWRSTRR